MARVDRGALRTMDRDGITEVNMFPRVVPRDAEAPPGTVVNHAQGTVITYRFHMPAVAVTHKIVGAELQATIVLPSDNQVSGRGS